MLARDGDAELLEARQLVVVGDEAVLDHKASTHYASVLIGFAVGVQHQVQGGVSHRVGSHPPAPLIEGPHQSHITLGGERLETVVPAFLTPRLLVGLPHPSAFEAAVDSQLDATDSKPRVAVVRTDAPGCDDLVQAIQIYRGLDPKQHARPQGEIAAAL